MDGPIVGAPTGGSGGALGGGGGFGGGASFFDFPCGCALSVLDPFDAVCADCVQLTGDDPISPCFDYLDACFLDPSCRVAYVNLTTFCSQDRTIACTDSALAGISVIGASLLSSYFECVCGACAADCAPIEQTTCALASCVCGDFVCDPTCGEDRLTCASDCADTCLCGDLVCDSLTCGENAATCPADCGECFCGDDICDGLCFESEQSCPADCATSIPCVCGDGVCDIACQEDSTSCPPDCPFILP